MPHPHLVTSELLYEHQTQKKSDVMVSQVALGQFMFVCENKGIRPVIKSLPPQSSNRNLKDAQRLLEPGTPVISPR